MVCWQGPVGKRDDLQMNYQKMSRRYLIGGDLQMSYQKMSYKCLGGDILDMSFRCIIVALSMFYLIYHK